MKKVLLTLLTLFAVGGVWAQVTETDRSSYLDVIYAESSQVLQGTTDFKLPINIKAHQNFTAVEFVLVLPDDVVVNDLAGMEDSRKQYVKTKGSEIYEYNDLGDGSYNIVGTVTCDRGLASGDRAFSYVSLDVSKLPAGDYSLIVKNATLSGFQNPETGVATGEADAVIADEIVTTLTITDCVVLDENSTTAPEAAENVNVLVKRSVKAGNWGTICLPFAMTEDQVKAAFGDGAQLADFTGAEIVRDAEELVSEIKVKFVTATSIEANHPYLLKLDKEFGDIKYEDGFKVDGVTINAKTTPQVGFDYNEDSESYLTFFKGVYVPTVLSNYRFMFLSGNKFYYTDTNTTIKGFRGYFRFRSVLADKYKNNSANVKIFVDEEATNIDSLVTPRVAEGVYDLSGRKIQLENGDLNKLQKGVYIIDGKKVTIK